MGAVTLVGPDRENLCRRATPHETEASGGLAWVIEAQGLPNLIHELVHALFLGRLDDDHGFDYGLIPLDIEHSDQRAHLWEELACCGLSTTTCAPFHGGAAADWGRSWFAEQFEIQGVFHGFDRDLAGFRVYIDDQLARAERVAELDATVARARGLLSAALAAVGGPSTLPPCDVSALWRDYRRSW
ncbi:hypothetical protein ENSA5_54310 [Enhygromyxa salina]|uniref:Uncharacterized protein n=1 Tax=Enhygromyxa salina TaxID=215803 RepID=A0A2S9XFB5_9BACT|nr:hypothetical protein [Enhygromyxa salina]PRP91555.1 hypothetical protein ENSA5_54310 [Enhygromyxa salina]